jgi:hypothetical protein
MAVRLSASRADRSLSPGRFLVRVSVTGLIGSKAIVLLEGFGSIEKIQLPHRESNPRPFGF